MSDLKMKDLIIELMTKHDITAYDVGQNTSVSTNTVKNLLDGSGTPRPKTLKIILKYLQDKIVGKSFPTHKNYDPNFVAEQPPTYTLPSTTHIISAIERLESILIPRIDALSKAAEVTILNTDNILEISNNTQNSFKSLCDLLHSKGIIITSKK